jgi:hypothetical protein
MLSSGDGPVDEEDIDVQAAKTDTDATNAAMIGAAVRLFETDAMGLSVRGDK